MFLCEASEELRSYLKKRSKKNEYKEKQHFESVTDEGFMHAAYVKNIKEKNLETYFFDKKMIPKKLILM